MQTLFDAVGSVRALWSFVDLVRNPDHLDRVFEISDRMVKRRTEVLDVMRDYFQRDATGAAALRDKPRLHVDLDALAKLPEGTLGRSFADHMRANGLDPKSLPTLAASNELEFIRAHL